MTGQARYSMFELQKEKRILPNPAISGAVSDYPAGRYGALVAEVNPAAKDVDDTDSSLPSHEWAFNRNRFRRNAPTTGQVRPESCNNCHTRPKVEKLRPAQLQLAKAKPEINRVSGTASSITD